LIHEFFARQVSIVMDRIISNDALHELDKMSQLEEF
jgi:hypothetical protein